MSGKEKSVSIEPSVFAESVFQLDGSPFRLDSRRYLKPIYDADIEEGIIMSGRQVEKSTTNSTKMATFTLQIPHFKALYFAPLTSQVTEFSKERLGKLYEYSQENVIKKNFIDRHSKQNVYHKDFTNGSVNYFKHCYDNGDNIRGISVNGIWGDEIQDINIDAIPVIKETQSHALDSGAKMRVTWYTGTPKTFSNTIQQYWDMSSQNEWIVRCPACNKYQIMGLKNLTPHAFICASCKKELTKEIILLGFWKPLRPDRKLKGFRISQLMVPWITPEDIWDKYETYSEAKFHNEVLGRSFENASKPFNAVMLERITDRDIAMYTSPMGEFSNKRLSMGVDWGTGDGSYTVVTIMGRNDAGKKQILYTKRYAIGKELDPKWQLDDIARLFVKFRISLLIVDWGFGYTQFKSLEKAFGSKKVIACFYSHGLKDKFRYDKKDGKMITNRTDIMQDFIDEVHDYNVVIPGFERDKVQFLHDHLLAVQAEYRTSRSGGSEELFYTHPGGMPDDGMHSCVYANMALDILEGTSGGKKVVPKISSFQG